MLVWDKNIKKYSTYHCSSFALAWWSPISGKTYNSNTQAITSSWTGTSFGLTNAKCIGSVVNTENDRIYWFIKADEADCIAEYDGRLSVIDFKTSKKRKVRSHCYNYFMQCSAYAIMFEERTGIPVDQTVVLITQEDDGPMIHVEKRDDFVPQLLEARDVYEEFLKTSAN